MKNAFNPRNLFLLPLLAALLAMLLAACGGGGGDAATSSTPTGPTLKSIAITPANSTIAVGTTETLVATGTYSDNSTAVLAATNQLAWGVKGSNASVVTATGVVTGLVMGPDTVTATVGSVVGSTAITIKGPWVKVVAGASHTVALKADGTLQAWGSNQWGQLGDGSTNDSAVPVQVSGGFSNWTFIAAGEDHVMAIRADGSLWGWGYNQNGQLGDGTQTNRSAPTKIGTSTDWVFVSAGKSHTVAINKGGVLWAWGRNFNGQLGDNTKVDKLVPTKIGAAVNWSSAAAGATHTLGRRADGSLWAWGGNAKGQVGNGSIVDVPAPVQIGTSTWVSVAAGTLHSVAIRADGALFAWGSNGNGQIGNGGLSTTNVTAPAQILASGLSNWSVIGAGYAHTVALRRDGTLYAWGSNSDGQLGDGLGYDTSSPNQIGTSANWNTVSAGLYHTFGTQTDGTRWGWGRAVEGQQGNGSSGASANAVLTPTKLP
ncbi:Ig-like domain-containing protein [Rugamonas sp.]|uniref:RCC1 domain-containing protein n=1 Tax=Rugamonas sp. TaxID=1926287 RepID=UPI0025E04513|nr:Ig-like domain-containing protein [Rugamonas sp.]